MISEFDNTAPYNTRRKLLSQPSLGIQLPVTKATKAMRRPSPQPRLPNTEAPFKKFKRSYDSSVAQSTYSDRTLANFVNTPPQSPEAEVYDFDNEIKPKKAWELVDDEVVEAVIKQLQKSKNRPHLVKELAAILSQSVKVVEQSANPSAIISSRLSSYMKRSWSALAPCLIAKELETVHPRRTHYYLTSYKCQPIPDPFSREYVKRAIISPPISSAASQDDETDGERRRELSPSPEVDLSPPEYDEDDNQLEASPTPLFYFSKNSYHVPRNHRSMSPPLEKDEKEFTQTARGMQKRKLSEINLSNLPSEVEEYPTKIIDHDVLFGRQSPVNYNALFASSPITNSSMHRRYSIESSDICAYVNIDWDVRSPESIELRELDEMFEDL